MKEQIYTIPVNEAFSQDCECPLCFLEASLEREQLEYTLGPSLMEPDIRLKTNKEGFCRRHFEMLYNRQENTLGLALIIETHFTQLLEDLDKDIKPFTTPAQGKGKDKELDNKLKKLEDRLDNQEKSCIICSKLDYTMERYIDVIFHLWVHEEEFRRVFSGTKGFCLPHFKKLLTYSRKYLNPSQRASFLKKLVPMQQENLKRIQEEINWFTRKFDYRNKDAPWKNSKDAVPRSIQKIASFMKLR